MLTIDKTNLARHHPPRTLSDRVAFRVVGMLRSVADGLFGRRYHHRTIVLETIAAVPGMVAATLLHLKCLRRMTDDRGWIRTLLDEAETQRAHLMVFVAIDRPSLP
jgi:ubiquinol oxidase